MSNYDPQYPEVYEPKEPSNPKDSGLAIASLVLGILSLLSSCCIFYVSIVLAIVSLVLGIVSLAGKHGGKGMAIAGIVLSSISVLLGIAVGVLFSFAMIAEFL